LKKVLITGSAGFTGRHLIQYLKNLDHLALVGLDIIATSDIKHHMIDMLDPVSIISVLEQERPDYIIHLAGINKSDSPELYYKCNVFTTINILEGIVKNELFNTKSLFISTSAVYGRATDSLVSESSDVNPINFYGSSKLSMETVIRQYTANYNIQTFIMRPFNLVGPGQSSDFVIPSFIEKLLKIKNGLKTPILNTGNLNSARDFIDVRDAVEAYWIVLNQGTSGNIYNLSSGEAVIIRDILNKIIDMVSTKSAITINEQVPSAGDILTLKGNSSKLRKLGWQNNINLDKSIQDLITSIENHNDE
jgi:GDP-4-dehydro-6-deoxy-D-mannose reductase